MIAFLNFVINVLGEFLSADFLSLWFFPMFALAFIATVPCFIRRGFTWR